MNETSSTNTTFFETINIQHSTLNTSITGGLNGTLNFSRLEIILINSGSFTGKGFSKGNWSANIEGASYNGSWQGMLFKKPDERKFYIKGTFSGGLKGVVEGNLVESVNGSDIYDKYQAVWTINQMDIYPVFAKVDVNGTVNYQNQAEYLSELYALQTYIVGKATGHYNVSLNIILTHVRIDNATNPYYGQGFSIFSYAFESGSGEGWTYDKTISSGLVELKGPFTEPLKGIASGFLNESSESRELSISVERIDVGSEPMAYPDVKVSGPQRVSPGQTLNYIVEYMNYGLKQAKNIMFVIEMTNFFGYISSSNGGTYIPPHSPGMIFWSPTFIPAKTVGDRIITIQPPPGLPQGTPCNVQVYYIEWGDDDNNDPEPPHPPHPSETPHPLHLPT